MYRLFNDLAILVQQQGEMIDNIEVNIRTAKDYVEKGEKNLVEAKKNLDSARKVSTIHILFKEKMLYSHYWNFGFRRNLNSSFINSTLNNYIIILKFLMVFNF